MKYDLIVSDFDGTFRRRDTSVGERTLRAVKQFTSADGKFVVCTGRMPSSIRPILQELGLNGVYVAYQGSIVGEIESGKFLRESGFTKAQALFVCRKMTDLGLRIHLYDADTCYVNYADEYLDSYERICRIRSERRDDLCAVIENSDRKFFKLLAMVEKSDRNKIRDELRRQLGEEYFVSCSASTLVEVTAVQDTKAAAVEFLSEYYGIGKSRILAFGDNQNDAPLLAAAGKGVAVANADPYLKEIADEVTEKTCDEDAVGEYIEKYVLSERESENKIVEVSAAFIREGDKFMICQRPAGKARGMLWEFVGGKREPGETGEEALVRECREELGVKVSVQGVFTALTHVYPDITVRLTLYHARIEEGKVQRLEHNDIRFITPAEIDEYAFCPADEEILEKIKREYGGMDR